MIISAFIFKTVDQFLRISFASAVFLYKFLIQIFLYNIFYQFLSFCAINYYGIPLTYLSNFVLSSAKKSISFGVMKCYNNAIGNSEVGGVLT